LIEQMPSMEGRVMTMVLSPTRVAKKPKAEEAPVPAPAKKSADAEKKPEKPQAVPK
jgi:hypothetical protein